MTTSPLDNLAEQTAQLLATIAALATHRGPSRERSDPSPDGVRSSRRCRSPSACSLPKTARRPARDCKRPDASSKARSRTVAKSCAPWRALKRSLQDRLDLGDVVVSTVTWPASVGHPSLVAITQRELEDVFVAMGFTVAEGPEVESDWYNFEALNIPPAHPARGMWDTFYVDLGEPETVVLRTHTSPTQIHLMEEAVAHDSLPIHSVMPGRCYRRDTPDPRHLATFHQIEGLVIDRGISFADFAGVIETFTRAYFGPDIESRLRPGLLPLHRAVGGVRGHLHDLSRRGMSHLFAHWMDRTRRLRGRRSRGARRRSASTASEWSGFAFGFGIDRCAQMRHEIGDMRALIENDTRFLEQFS